MSKITYHYIAALEVNESTTISSLKELVDKTVAENTQQKINKNDEEYQVYLEPLPLVSYHKRVHTLHTLRRYNKEYKWSDREFLRAL